MLIPERNDLLLVLNSIPIREILKEGLQIRQKMLKHFKL